MEKFFQVQCYVVNVGICGFSSDFLSFGEVQGKYTRANGPTIEGFRVFFPFLPAIIITTGNYFSEHSAFIVSPHRELLEPH